jgi:DNA-binding phage protein
MIKRRPKRSTRTLTEAERERMRAVREQIDTERPEILAKARELKRARAAAVAQLHDAFALLRSERQSRGISLSELRQRTGIGRSALSRLENDPEANPTITTLARVADALGKQIVIQLVEKPKE